MKLVIALGGNALLRRGEPLTAPNQLANIRRAAAQIALVAPGNELVLTHGNGPQVGLLALQAAAYAAASAAASAAADTAADTAAHASSHAAVASYPLDVLGAQTDGMIGYLLEQELGNLLPARVIATLITRIEVSLSDPAFAAPTKPIGPIYSLAEAQRIGAEQGWTMAPDGKAFRRVVASPAPQRVLGLQPIKWLLAHGALVIAAGGGGIPVARHGVEVGGAGGVSGVSGVGGSGGGAMHGVEAVIDKDACSSLLARELDADLLIIATDVDAVYLDFGLPAQRRIGRVTSAALAAAPFPAGSMGPKVEAACAFVNATGRRAVIGSLDHIEAMLKGSAGTQVIADGAQTL